MSGPGDEFLIWVRFAVPGMLAESNVAAMDHALAGKPRGLPAIEFWPHCDLSIVVARPFDRESISAAVLSQVWLSWCAARLGIRWASLQSGSGS